MRGLVITLALFVILLGIITVNSIFVKYSVQKMRYTVENLQLIPCSQNQIIINELDTNWKRISLWLSLSVCYEDIEELTDVIDAAKAANETDNVEQFKIHVNLLLNAIDELGRLEKFSIKNIL